MIGSKRLEPFEAVGGRGGIGSGAGSPGDRAPSSSVGVADGIFVVGMSHRTAPIAVRERFAVVADRAAEVLDSACRRLGAREACLLSTCNRVELMLAFDDQDGGRGAPPGRKQALRSFFDGLGSACEPSDESMYVLEAREAVRHMFRVAASLESLVVGETQISGQLRAAMLLAQERGRASRRLLRVLEGALRTASRVYARTAIGEGRVSVSSVAVELASKVFGEAEGRTALVVGAGDVARLVSDHLGEWGIKQFTVVNRSIETARALAADIGGTALPLEALAESLPGADVVVAATGAPRPILSAETVRRALRARRGRPMLLLDLAVPRDIDPSVEAEEGAFRFDLDDLEAAAAENLARRYQEVKQATAMVDAELEKFLSRTQVSKELGPIISAVRSRGHDIARAEAARLFGRLPGLGAGQRREIEAMASRVVNKLLHAPMLAIKKEAAEGGLGERTATFGRLFGLEVGVS